MSIIRFVPDFAFFELVNQVVEGTLLHRSRTFLSRHITLKSGYKRASMLVSCLVRLLAFASGFLSYAFRSFGYLTLKLILRFVLICFFQFNNYKVVRLFAISGWVSRQEAPVIPAKKRQHYPPFGQLSCISQSMSLYLRDIGFKLHQLRIYEEIYLL